MSHAPTLHAPRPGPALAGVRVLELGGYLASPFAGNILRHLGAEVIKIEPLDGDPTRTIKGGTPGGTFIAYSAGKKSVCLDLACDGGQDALARLLPTADVLIHNFSVGTARKLGVTRERCHRIHPGLVHCHISGYGAGPRHEELASNPVIEAATGVMHANRVDGRPARMGPSYHDMFAGMQAVIGILSCLTGDRRLETERCVEVGLYETGLHVAARDLVAAQADKQRPADQVVAPAAEFGHPGYGAYRSADGRWVFLLMLSDRHWSLFAQAMELPQADDPGLATRAQRERRHEEVETIVRDAIASCTWSRLIPRLERAGLGHTEVKPPLDVLDDPQAQAPGKVEHFVFDGLRFDVPSFPVVLGQAAPNALGRPPMLGEHTWEVLRSLGLDHQVCDALARSGAARMGAAP